MKVDMKLYTANYDDFEIHENKMRKGNELVKNGTSLSEYSNIKLIMSDSDIFEINTIAKMDNHLSYPGQYKPDVD